jgi:hypothetical protein
MRDRPRRYGRQCKPKATEAAVSAFDLADDALTNHVERLAEVTSERGFILLRGQHVRSLLTDDQFDSLRAAWNNLPADEEAISSARGRYRRYGRMRVEVDQQGPRFSILPHTTFRQNGIPLWKDKDRTFAPIDDDMLLHPGMTALIGFDTALAATITGRKVWEVGVHQIRLVTRRGSNGQPTPEGRHRDGHVFVGMHLMRREDCEGGQSTVYAGDEPTQLILLDPLDSMFVDDRRLTHEVSPTSTVHDVGIRDMLLVDVNPSGGAL